MKQVLIDLLPQSVERTRAATALEPGQGRQLCRVESAAFLVGRLRRGLGASRVRAQSSYTMTGACVVRKRGGGRVLLHSDTGGTVNGTPDPGTHWNESGNADWYNDWPWETEGPGVQPWT